MSTPGDGNIPNKQPEGKKERDRPTGPGTPEDLAVRSQVGKLPDVGHQADARTFEKNGMASNEQLLGGQKGQVETKEALTKFGKATVDALNNMGFSSDTFKALVDSGMSKGAVEALVLAGAPRSAIEALAQIGKTALEASSSKNREMKALGSEHIDEKANKVAKAFESKDPKALQALISSNEPEINKATLVVENLKKQLAGIV